jgi:hypothetical protein
MNTTQPTPPPASPPDKPQGAELSAETPRTDASRVTDNDLEELADKCRGYLEHYQSGSMFLRVGAFISIRFKVDQISKWVPRQSHEEPERRKVVLVGGEEWATVADQSQQFTALQAQLTAATEALEKAKAELKREDSIAAANISKKDRRIRELLDEREQSGKREASLREALVKSRDANCCMSYGALQVDAVELANKALAIK